MTVLVCIPCLLNGGTEIQTLSLVEALVAAGHKPVVACYFEQDEEMVERFRRWARVAPLSPPERSPLRLPRRGRGSEAPLGPSIGGRVLRGGEYVGYCGRISGEKGIDIIIEAARLHPEIPFKFAGGVRDKELVADLPANVELLGYLSGKELEEFYRNARFFVMASRCYEGFPMAVLEAGQYGKPMVAPNHGGFREIIEGSEATGCEEISKGEKTTSEKGKTANGIGMLFEANNAEDFERTIVSLWNDEALTMELGKRALEKIAKDYSTEAVARQWKTLLENLKRAAKTGE